MQSIQTFSSKLSTVFFTASLSIVLLTGCSLTTQDMFADTVGVVPDYDVPQVNSPEEVKIAINELAVQDPTARAALKRDEVVPQDEKKKIVPRLILQTVTSKKQLNDPHSTGITNSLPAKKNITIEQNAPLKLNQLYFDNRDKHYWENLDAAPSPLVKLAKASYSSIESPQVIHPLSVVSPQPASKLETLIVTANQRVASGSLPTYVLPMALIVFGLIICAAAYGYNLEIQRIRAAEKNELARKNLWTKGLTELLPREHVAPSKRP